jgi:Flp pilus assembly protein TadD
VRHTAEERELRAEIGQAIGELIRGSRTLAQIEGMTYEQAREIAEIGCGLARRGRIEDARVVFEGLVAGNPFDTSAQAALGTVYQRLGRVEDAMVCYDKAIDLFEENVVALANRGELRLRQGDHRGLSDLGKAVQVDANGISAAGRRARAVLKAFG